MKAAPLLDETVAYKKQQLQHVQKMEECHGILTKCKERCQQTVQETYYPIKPVQALSILFEGR